MHRWTEATSYGTIPDSPTTKTKIQISPPQESVMSTVPGGATPSVHTNTASATDDGVPALRTGVEYRCGDCGAVHVIKGNDAIRCRSCGFRILYKVRTRRCECFIVSGLLRVLYIALCRWVHVFRNLGFRSFRSIAFLSLSLSSLVLISGCCCQQ